MGNYGSKNLRNLNRSSNSIFGLSIDAWNPNQVKFTIGGQFCQRKNEGVWFDENGAFHREDGPAVEGFDDQNGYKAWYIHGKRHREDGPALITVAGTRMWYKHDKRHRLDGPAVLYAHAQDPEWWFEGKNVTRAVIQDMTKIKKFSSSPVGLQEFLEYVGLKIAQEVLET